MSATLGEAFYSYGVFFDPIEAEFGWSRSIVSSGFTVFVIGFGVSAAISGRLADRYSPRSILIPSAIIAGLGMALCRQVSTIDQLRLFLLMAGMGSGATLSIPTSSAHRWFRGRRSAGIALAVVVAGTGTGQLLFTPLINYFVMTWGWRQAYLITGIIFFAIIVPASFMITRPPDETRTDDNSSTKPAAGGWSAARAIATSAYALTLFCLCSALVSNQVVTVHFVPNALDNGMSATAAASMLGLLGGMTVPGRVVSGFISTRLGWRKTLALATCGMAGASVLLIFARSEGTLLGFALMFGIFSGIRTVAQWGILNEFFGLSAIGAITGITSALTNLITAGAPYLTGYIFDATGSYTAAFAIMAALLIAGSVAGTLVRKPALRPVLQ